MPKGFSEHERAQIQAGLIAQAQRFLATTGVRKTSVEDLTSAVGISKGAFYLFFPSKEELFFSVFEQFEQAYRQELLAILDGEQVDARTLLHTFLQRSFSLWRSSPLFTHFSGEDFAYLARKLPPERMQQNQQSDQRFAQLLIERLQLRGVQISWTAPQFSGLLRALFFVSLHEGDIGSDAYPAVHALLIDLVAQHFANAGR